MADISRLIHLLRERIESSPTSSSSNSHAEEPIEATFRTVLPKLLHDYVVPSSTAKEREVIAVLKLSSHIAKKFPGVFFHGDAAAVIPLIGRILPFFSEPSFCSRHELIFETVGSLLALLRVGNTEVYRQFFLDATFVVEDILCIVTNVSNMSLIKNSNQLLKCYSQSFAQTSTAPNIYNELPTFCKPKDGPGLLVDITDKRRWQSFVTWTIKLISKCLTEGTLYVEGLITLSFVNAVGTFLCYKDAFLHIACFNFIRIVSGIMDNEVTPFENLIRSILIIIGQHEKSTVHRNAEYDSSMGACLHILHSSSADSVVSSTACELVDVFPKGIRTTNSLELKLAMCSAYIRVAKICAIHIWKPTILLNMILCSKPCLPLINCFQVAIDLLGPNLIGECSLDDDHRSSFEGVDRIVSGKKRSAQDNNDVQSKRQKVNDNILLHNLKRNNLFGIHACLSTCERNKDYSYHMREALISFVNLLKPGDIKDTLLKPKVAVTALSTLCIVFCNYPNTDLSHSIFRQIIFWMPWICQQTTNSTCLNFELPLYLEALRNIFLLQGILPNNMRFFKDDNCSDDDKDKDSNYPLISDLCNLLKSAWTHTSVIVHDHPPWRHKCTILQILSLISNRLKDDSHLELLDRAIDDEVEDVRVDAVLTLPLFIFYSGGNLHNHVMKRLEFLAKDRSNHVIKFFSLSVGYLACLQGSYDHIDESDKSSCKIFHGNFDGRQIQTMDFLLKYFWCSQCDKGAIHSQEKDLKVHYIPKDDIFKFDFVNMQNMQSFFFQPIFSDLSEGSFLSFVRIIPRLLRHCNRDYLIGTKFQWIESINIFLLHKSKAVREAFSIEIGVFAEKNILNCLFFDDLGFNDSKEHEFVEKLRCALSMTEDPKIFETILESVGTVMNSVDVHECLFYYSLILLVDQLDNSHATVRMIATNIIHRSCFHMNGGFEAILSKYTNIRDKLFDYLCSRLVTCPEIIREFAEAILKITVEDFLNKIVPVVLPKLVTSHHDTDQALVTLRELASHLNTDIVPLIVNWLPGVLAFALFQEDEQVLSSALQFYHLQTGSNSKEIFSAALPALLDELVCFKGNSYLEETEIRRVSRIPLMIQKIARILTGFDDLPLFLKNHFVGLLNSVDRKMLHSDNLWLQKQALKRIEKLIEMMGSNINMYVPKIMVLLMHALEKDTLQFDGLSVLNFFIKQLVKLSPSSIRHVISQVVAGFIPFLERYQEIPNINLKKFVDVLEELIVENTQVSKQHIRELPLLPCVPVLSKINRIIEEARGSMSLRDQLRDAVAGLIHESLNVRYMVACELSKLLNSKREDITALIAEELIPDMDVLSTLITSLLKGCAEESRTTVGQKLKLVCADCLGALGAVDPAKFKGISCQRFKIECSDDDLIFELIDKYLARAFKAASKNIIQDSAALAIQELLKIVGCQASLDKKCGSQFLEISKEKNVRKKDEIISRGQRLWDRFSNYVKDIIAPCLTSRFQLPCMTDSTSFGPIYHPSLSLRRWIFFWIRKLSAHATGSRASIFIACRGIVRHDMQTSLYLLPYLVLNAVCHGTVEARDGITQEILSVLNAAAENSSINIHGLVGVGQQSEVCIQAVFTLLDNLGQWVDDLKQEVALSQYLNVPVSKQSAKARVTSTTSDVDQLLVQCKNVSELLEAIPKVTLARASFYCRAYARALLYFESHVRERAGSFNPAAESNGVFIDDDISFLMEIYSGLDEPDGLSGFANLRRSPSLSDQLLINQKAGNWADVSTSCEHALQMEPSSVQSHCGVLKCLLNMCHLQSMLTHVDGLITRVPQHKKTWCMQGVQAAWRLGRWDLMGEYLVGANANGDGASYSISENTASFDIDLAKILQAMMNKDQFVVAERIAQTKQALIVPLAAAGMDSYMRAYPFVVKLHMLCELEDFNSLLDGESFLQRSFHLDDAKFCKAVKDWDNRLRLTQPSLWAREPLLAFRRLVFSASNMVCEVGDCWLQYAKLCRSAGHYETAQRAILEAQALGLANVHMEKAKLLWNTRRSDCAIAELQQSLLNTSVEVLGTSAINSLTSLSLIPPNPLSKPASKLVKENIDVAKTLLLYTRWIHHTGQKQKKDIIQLYSRVTDLQPNWEKGYFFMAKYCDDLLVDARKRQEEVRVSTDSRPSGIMTSNSNVTGKTLSISSEEKPWWTQLPDVLLFYAKCLHKGHSNLFQAFPRLLTLWFEFGSIYQRDAVANNKELKTIYTKVMSVMRGCFKDLPTYQWLTVLSQLISRICHQNDDVVRIVKHIIISVIQEYPQQSLWMIAAVSKSTIAARRNAASEIIQSARKSSKTGSNNANLFTQFAGFIDHLIKLCFHPGQPRAKTINISTEFSALKRMMPLGIIMPFQQALTVTLPAYDTYLSDPSRHNIFSDSELVTISGIADEAEILTSLQKPKKVVFLGSDGVYRPFLCKPKDDLRKDARMMEFTAMINRLLSKFPESRRRKLYIRTFAVIPLTEDCGIVEWVPNTRGFRNIVQDIYITCGKFDKQKTHVLIKRIFDQYQGKLPEDEMLKFKILPMFPPVFHKWFISTFSEPASWFRARSAYAHTAAVWSMVGHIVGLGDRHGENILFDSTTGDCIHVDFSCLFDRGLQLERPELVPFRLTQNMIDGLGITGYEGVFLKVCEITLSVLRSHRETLMSVLETFLHDPLVEWTKTHKSSGVEVQNPHAQRAISNIKARLQGVVVGVGAAPSLPLAVEGQARRLIAEAVSHKNLGKMYIWWMSWF